MVCGNECVIDLEASDVSTAICTMPPVMTTFSAATFNMVEATVIPGTWEGTGSSAELAKLNDVDYLNDYEDSSTPCYFSLSASDGYAFQVDNAKVFIDNLQDKSPYD